MESSLHKRMADMIDSMISGDEARALGARWGWQRPVDVTDPELDAPDGEVVDGMRRAGDQWLSLPLTSCERESLLVWVRHRMAAYAEGAGEGGWNWTSESDGDLRAMSEWIALDLFDDDNFDFSERALDICRASMKDAGNHA